MNTDEFIKKFRSEDIRQLALQGSRYPEVDMPFALNQIAGWQTARTKLPSWASCDGIIYPPHLSMEQCSSEQTALCKFSKVVSLCSLSLQERAGGEASFLDITGGFGVDFSFLARHFKQATYVERQEHLCDIARHNFEVLGLSQARVVCGDGVEYLRTTEPVDFIYLDPARRDSHGGRTYALEDCTPNVLELKDLLLEKAPVVMVKLSPMLDWHKVVTDLGCVSHLMIISTRNECKEMVVVMTREKVESLSISAINDNETVDFCESEATSAIARVYSNTPENLVGKYLYEPNASIMKAGCFGLLCERFGVQKIGTHSNLYVSDEMVTFPGRQFKISAVSSMNKKELKRALSGIDKANIAVRNFPLSVDALRKQLKLKDGGDTYIFGTTLDDNKHILLLSNKVPLK